MKAGHITAKNEYEGALLLREWGIPVVDQILADDEAEAADAAEKLGFPVVLKVCSEKVLHKTEQGGVVLNVPNRQALRTAARDMLARFDGIAPKLLVQKMADSGVEIILGARRDPVFGPVVLAGIGGIFTEIFRDTVVEIAPVNLKTARSMLMRLKGAALLQGYRSRPPVDIDAVARALQAVSRLIVKRHDIVEIDVNPLIARENGALAVDTLIRCNGKAKTVRAKAPAAETVDPFFNPSSLALIGASQKPGKGGNTVLRNLLKAGFQGKIYPINPATKEILGMKAYPRVVDVPEPIDLAILVIPKPAVSEAVADCLAKGIRNIILSMGGFSDIGEAGAAEQNELVARTRAAGARIMGPNSIGTINPRAGLATSFVGLEQIRPGGVSLIGQSGVFSSGWGRWIADYGPFGIAKVACIGNKADINESDLLDYLAGDDQTTTIGMYIEGVADGGRFIKAAASACCKKPVVVVKSGRSEAGAAAVASHTGSLACSDVVFEAVCRRTGLVRVHDSEAFFDTLSAFESLPLPRGNRMGVLSITGMGCVVTTDAAEELGIEIPPLKPATLSRLREVIPAWAPVRNPVDIWSAVEQHGSKKTMSHVAASLLEQQDIDALLMIFVLMPESIFDIGEAFADIIKAHPRKPVFVSYYGGTRKEMLHIHEGFLQLGVPAYPTPERALYAFSRMVEYARFKGLIKKRS
ncbi:MAG: acetate--CoA ligase family protein [Desulfomonilia bacterium]|uniref:Succinyl-CoA synthetase subunit alpha n=1 Tax=anaerobic digester metagenome TaxID=1263854 RepID=A0A485M6L0_9ZZZZ|nr:acetate--CoA ligase family protein [Desulfomonilia bacterium]HRV36780.1 acetate--CoA ligase family protein [Desulfomonilia bacterium]